MDGSYGLQLSQLAGERHNVTLIALPATEAVVPVAVGAAVPKGQAGSELGLRLTGGLVAAMSRGNESDVLRLQEEFLVPNGIPASAAVQTLVDSLTYLV